MEKYASCSDKTVGYVTINQVLKSLPNLLQRFKGEVTGDEPITAAVIVQSDDDPEYPKGSLLLELTNADNITGILSITPNRVSRQLN